jgi:hypothetical protein
MKPPNVLPQLGNKSEHKIFMSSELWHLNNSYIGLNFVQNGYIVLGDRQNLHLLFLLDLSKESRRTTYLEGKVLTY